MPQFESCEITENVFSRPAGQFWTFKKKPVRKTLTFIYG